jgi:hypothetical protein
MVRALHWECYYGAQQMLYERGVHALLCRPKALQLQFNESTHEQSHCRRRATPVANRRTDAATTLV